MESKPSSLRRTVGRLGDAALLLFLKAGLAVMLFAFDKLLLWLIGMVLSPGTKAYNLVEVLVNVAFVGAAVTVSFIGAVFFIYEVAMASWDHARRWRNDGKGS
ncbi:MAG: hypothetical protein HYU30_06250 [Chloroflexi bacterium]|nr:hypothetical protein [Chloroflexota bacterium]